MRNYTARIWSTGTILRRFITFAMLALTVSGCAKVSGKIKKIGQSILPVPFSVTVEEDTYAVTEGSAAGVVFVLSEKRTVATVLTISYPDGAGTTDADFLASPTTVTIPAGSLSKTLTLSTYDDAIYEGTEVHRLELSSEELEVKVDDDTVAVTINDNEVAPEINFAAASQNINEGAGTGTAAVTIDRESSQNILVAYLCCPGNPCTRTA